MEKSGEFRRGWPVLAAASVGIGLGMSPLPFYTIGVFIPPLLAEFGGQGWDVGFIINALAVYTFGSMAAAPIIGILAEKFGARRVALVAAGPVAVNLPNGHSAPLAATIEYDGPLKAPLVAGQKVAVLTITAPDMAAAQIPLMAREDVALATALDRVANGLVGWLPW